MRKTIVAAAAAAAMIAGSSAAQAAPVALESVRSGSAVSEAEELRGKAGVSIMLGIVAAIIFAFVVSQVMDNDEDQPLPSSP